MLLTIWTISVPLSCGQVYDGETGVELVPAELTVLVAAVELTDAAGEALDVETETATEPAADSETAAEPETAADPETVTT